MNCYKQSSIPYKSGEKNETFKLFYQTLYSWILLFIKWISTSIEASTELRISTLISDLLVITFSSGKLKRYYLSLKESRSDRKLETRKRKQLSLTFQGILLIQFTKSRITWPFTFTSETTINPIIYEQKKTWKRQLERTARICWKVEYFLPFKFNFVNERKKSFFFHLYLYHWTFVSSFFELYKFISCLPFSSRWKYFSIFFFMIFHLKWIILHVIIYRLIYSIFISSHFFSTFPYHFTMNHYELIDVNSLIYFFVNLFRIFKD